MLRLPGFLHRWDWQKPEHETDWTQTSHKKWWCQKSHCCTSSTDKPQRWLGHSAQCLTYSTNYFQRLTLESWYANLEPTPLNRCQQLPAPYKRHDANETDKRILTDRLDLTNYTRTSTLAIWLTKDGSNRNWPMTDDKLYTSLSANTIMAKVTNHFQRTKLITSSTDKHYSLDSEDDFRSGCRNVSHQQQFTHPDDHTIRTNDWIYTYLEIKWCCLVSR